MPNLLEFWQLGHTRSIANTKKIQREIPWETVKPPQKIVKKTNKTWQDPKNPWKTREFCTLSIWSFLWVGRPCLISSNPIVQHPTRGLPCGLCMFCVQVTLNHPSRTWFAWFVPSCCTSNDPNILGWLNDLIFIGSFGLDPKNRGLWKYRVYIGTYKFNQIHNFNIARYVHENLHKTSLRQKKLLNWVENAISSHGWKLKKVTLRSWDCRSRFPKSELLGSISADWLRNGNHKPI